MTKVIAATLLSILTAQAALAACPSNQTSDAAKALRISGRVSVTESTVDGAKTDSDPDKAVRFSLKSENGKLFVEIAKQKNAEVISSVFGLEEEGAMFGVVRNTESCAISLMSTDGEEALMSQLIDGGIKKSAISFYNNAGNIVTVSKARKSKLIVN